MTGMAGLSNMCANICRLQWEAGIYTETMAEFFGISREAYMMLGRGMMVLSEREVDAFCALFKLTREELAREDAPLRIGSMRGVAAWELHGIAQGHVLEAEKEAELAAAEEAARRAEREEKEKINGKKKRGRKPKKTVSAA